MQKAVEITSQDLTLRGMLHVPEGAVEKVPMVIIFHGFTGNKMEPHFIFVKLSRMLEKAGIASVRFDFGCSGESDGEFVNMTFSGEVTDAKNILENVKSLDFVDQDSIGVLGLSMGGAVASVLAGDRCSDIKSLCLWAPAATMRDYIYRTRTEEEIERFTEEGILDIGGLWLGYGWFDDIQSMDIYQRAAGFDKNVFIIHGDRDLSVPLSTSEKYLEIYGKRGKLHVLEGADHTFNKIAWEDEVLQLTVEYMKKELLLL